MSSTSSPSAGTLRPRRLCYDDQPLYRRVSNRTVNRTASLLRRITNWAGDVLSADVPGMEQLRWSEVIFKKKLGLERKRV